MVLAHFFAFLVDFRAVWWIGGIGGREVRGIEGVVGGEWRGEMGWPVRVVEEVEGVDGLDVNG